ncbi:adenosylcobinamide-phosphate synthase CbiB [Paracoccus sp. (in: a-proteobacteria)]|uniref:adenosylcobinamide-phosphate synthase CbiB n=1 Tax=Paracoccus sp. TaxID=267 RepID=UPI003A8AB077
MPLTALIALALDAVIGWPDPLFRRIGHPVTWIGALIALLDRRMNAGRARVLKGTVASLIVIAGVALPALALQLWLGPVIAGVLAWPLVAARSLHQHLRAVQIPLTRDDLARARAATAMIVGRDISNADEPALARASIESLAENASDGVVAPLFWAAVAGLPGIAAYKAINTLDSMIGHRTPRHLQFGCFAARLDDVANWIPARLTALLFTLASGRLATASVALRDARLHRSPNAGWPEAAMAAALSVRLSGPRIYAGRIADEPWLNGAARDPNVSDIGRGLALYRRAVVIAGLLLLGLTLARLGL